MAFVEIMPVIGTMSLVRSETLRGCHALTDHTGCGHFEPGRLGETLESLTKRLLAHDDYLRERLGRGDEVLLLVRLKP